MGCTIFISSTCYDLIDLRHEVAKFLESNGFVTKLSEHPESAFEVAPDRDSIQTCLLNVETSDAVVCVVDQRYGGVIRDGDLAGISATEAEINHARAKRVPVFAFIRDKAQHDYEQFRHDEDSNLRWVEKDSELAKRQKWKAFVESLSKHCVHHGNSNWMDQFRTSIDLKAIVLKRLTDYFPQHRGSLAMHPSRLVRLTFRFDRGLPNGEVKGAFYNVGQGPALNLIHGWIVRSGERKRDWRACGALREGDAITLRGHEHFDYHTPRDLDVGPVLFCEYENRFGDRYRVEVPLAWDLSDQRYTVLGEENFLPDPTSIRDEKP